MNTLFPESAPHRRRRHKPGRKAARQIEKAVTALLKAEPSTADIGEVLDCIDDICRRLEPRMNEHGTQP